MKRKRLTQWIEAVLPQVALIFLLVVFVVFLFLPSLAIAFSYAVLLIIPGPKEQPLTEIATLYIASLSPLILGTLAVITWLYARSTEKIAKATQALARETEATRQDNLLPVVYMTLQGSTKWDSPVGKGMPERVDIRASNFGPGPAFGVVVRVDRPPIPYSEEKVPLILQGQEKVLHLLRQGAGTQPPSSLTLLAAYRDAYGREISSEQTLKADKGSSNYWAPDDFKIHVELRR